MNILEKIIAHKKEEVQNRKNLYPIKLLEQSIYYETPVVSMTKYLHRADKSGIIAEFKRRSPSKGAINLYATVEQVSIGYMQAGASGLSVLTDEKFFGGKSADLSLARKYNFCPILRKDFIIDEYQIVEAKSIGADIILLIAECLDKERLQQLARTAKNLGLEVLTEVHSEAQLDKLCQEVDIVGVNNRNLENFEVRLETSLQLADLIPAEFTKISESGISNPQSIITLKEAGFKGFLIGETFMKTANPAKTCLHFVQQVEGLEKQLQNA